MFVAIAPTATSITIYVDDRPVAARRGETVAACLLREGTKYFRTTPISGSPRLPYCMIGHCFECLVEVDGVGNRQACLTIVAEGMRVRVQHGAAVIPERAA